MSSSYSNSVIEVESDDPHHFPLDSESVFAPDGGAPSQLTTSRTVSVSGRRRKVSANASWLWAYFKKCDEGIICCQCPSKKQKSYSIHTGNSTLKRHLEVTHKIKEDGKTGDPEIRIFWI